MKLLDLLTEHNGIVDGIYQCVDDYESPNSLSYENIGENFQPCSGIEYMPIAADEFGAYGASARLAINLLGEGCTILDLGAGLGSASIPLAVYGANVIAVDISQAMLRYGVEKANGQSIADNILFARMSAYDLKFNDNVFDAVVVNSVLQQLEKPQLLFDEVKRVLKPDGVYLECGGAYALPLTDEQIKINEQSKKVLNDIDSYYNSMLDAHNFVYPVSYYAVAEECKEKNLELIANYVSESEDEYLWTGHAKSSIIKTKTRASGHAQLIPDDIHNEAWDKTDKYAREKHGENYDDLMYYSHYTGGLNVYKLKLK